MDLPNSIAYIMYTFYNCFGKHTFKYWDKSPMFYMYIMDVLAYPLGE